MKMDGKKKFIFKTTTLIILIIFLIGLATAQVITNINMNLKEEDKETLSRVGLGIGDIQKERMLFDENGTNYLNETYIDVLKLIPQGCSNGYCHFKLYESGSINKPFQVKLERICAKEGICKEFGEEYECCKEWRAETDSEVLKKAETESKLILNKIISVTKERESRQREERFEEIEINI